MSKLNPGHYLMGCRLDNWLRLLGQNHFHVERDKIPQALLISAASLLLFPFALLEAALFNRKIRATPLPADPVFILGHWRSGTTYLQNMLTRDERFAWADPVNTNTFPNSILLGWLLRPGMDRMLKNARPMDNLQYRVDLPMEETFALLTISDESIIHLIAFPENYQRYLSGAFVDDMSPRRQEAWKRTYDFVLRKLNYRQPGKRLLLKSPDNTAHLRQLMELYPSASYINIHRDPYSTIRSTIHMFHKQMEILRLSPLPPVDMDVLLEDMLVEIFRRMYTDMFALQTSIPAERWVDMAYEDFVAAPVEKLEEIYRQLDLGDFEAARAAFERHAASQKNYVKNKLEISPRLRQKINSQLGFYFERYGYAMEEE